jgi:hypothetical protein
MPRRPTLAFWPVRYRSQRYVRGMSARLGTDVLFYMLPLWTRNDFGQTLPAPKPFSRQALSMKFSTFLLAATTLALPGIAAAQPVTGLYVGAGAGANLLQNEPLRRAGFAAEAQPDLRYGLCW